MSITPELVASCLRDEADPGLISRDDMSAAASISTLMADLNIRLSSAADDDQLGKMLVRAYAAQYARKMPEVEIGPGRQIELRATAQRRNTAIVLVAEMGHTVIGTVAVFAPESSESEAWMDNFASIRFLAVAEAFQGLGLSRPLMNAAEACVQTMGAGGACLHIRRGCEGISRVYESRGYVRDPSGDLDKRPQVFLEAYSLTFEASG